MNLPSYVLTIPLSLQLRDTLRFQFRKCKITYLGVYDLYVKDFLNSWRMLVENFTCGIYFLFFFLFTYFFLSSLWPDKHIKRWTLLKSVHIYKKHRVQYEVRTHFLIMKFARLTGSTADTFLEYVQRNLPEGVAMKVTKVNIDKKKGVCSIY